MWVYPNPKNMDSEHSGEWWKARAKAMVELHAEMPGTRYVDAAEYRDKKTYATVAIDATNRLNGHRGLGT